MNIRNLILRGPEHRPMSKLLMTELESPYYDTRFQALYFEAFDSLLERMDNMLNTEIAFSLQLALRQ